MNSQIEKLRAVNKPKIDGDSLVKLSEQHEKIQILQAELNAVKAKFDFDVTKEMVKRHLDVRRNGFCTMCGCIYDIKTPSCECNNTQQQ